MKVRGVRDGDLVFVEVLLTSTAPCSSHEFLTFSKHGWVSEKTNTPPGESDSTQRVIVSRQSGMAMNTMLATHGIETSEV